MRALIGAAAANMIAATAGALDGVQEDLQRD